MLVAVRSVISDAFAFARMRQRGRRKAVLDS